jgi:hypothetical protein
MTSNWSAIVTTIIFVLTTAVGYGVLMQQVRSNTEQLQDIKMEVKEISRSFTEFLIAQQPRKTARQ